MIASWKEFLIAVEQMRECQKTYFRSNSRSALILAKKCEKEVDAVIREKRSEWERKIQPELGDNHGKN